MEQLVEGKENQEQVHRGAGSLSWRKIVGAVCSVVWYSPEYDQQMEAGDLTGAADSM